MRIKGAIVCAAILAMVSFGQEHGNVEILSRCATEWSGLIGDGNCDPILNNKDCGYDGGDCCECTCVDGTGYSCGYSGFNCLDKNATACPGKLTGQYADCKGDLAFFGDGSCDYENNNESCGYDGGDCCECTCYDGWYYTCGDNSFNCMDPDAPCHDANNATSVYPNCSDGSIATIGDSICDDDNNNEACGYDGGDCCECTCTDGQYPSCGLYDFNCLDPESPKAIYNCEETPPPALPCPDGGQHEWLVENTYQAMLLSEAVYCSGGMFSVTWKGSITINTTIVVLNETVLNVTGHSSNASIDGGGIRRIFTAVNASLHVNNMVLGNGSATSGGAVVASGSNLTFNRTSFVNHTTPSIGGALYVAGASTVVFYEDTIFSDNNAGVRGGGIYVSERGSVLFSGEATFANNSALRGGGFYLTSGANVSWQGAAMFSDNTATECGSAVCLDGSSVAAWSGETIFYCNSAGTGGVYVNDASSASWAGPTKFFGNRANTTAGGAIRVTGASKASWSGELIFEGNIAEEDGGAIAITTGSSVSWSGDTLFLANTAFSDGGAFAMADAAHIEWTSTTRFVSNYAEESGGAIFVKVNSSVAWSGDTIFRNNTASTRSGGAILINSDSTMEWLGQTIFSSNTAGSNGGAVASYPFDPNSQESISEVESTLVVDGPTTFVNNSCGGNGGSLALLGTLSVSFGTTDVNFSSNSAEVSGGAIFISSTATGPVFTNINFDSNYAQVGGAVYVTGSGTSLVRGESSATEFVECMFTGNTASATGGAIESAAGVDIFNGSHFYRNSAELGGALRLAGTATLDKCYFIENISGEERGPAVSNIGYMSDIDECYFRGNMFNCDSGEFLEFVNEGDINGTVCDGCSDCSTCLFYEPQLVPTCTSTMENTKSDGGTDTIEDIVVNAGFWRATNKSDKVLPCYNPDACPEGVTSGMCNPGYQGSYCSICSKNYTNSIQYTCTECYDRSSGIAMIAVLTVFGTSIAISVFFHLVSGGKEGAGPGIVNRLKRNIPLQSVKIIIVAWQIVTQFASVVDVTYPDVYRHLLDALDVLNFDLSWAFSLGCFVDVDFHDRVLIMTIGPIMVISLLGITYGIGVWRNGQSEDTLRNIRHKHVSMVLLVTFLVYSSVSSVLFQMFDCDYLDDGRYYLQADYRIECDSPKHRSLEVYAGVMILLFPIGIPVFYACLLFRSHAILIDRDRRENDVTAEPTSDLWNPYKPSRFYYEVIECIRRILLTIVVFLVDDDTAAQISAVLMIAFIFLVLFEVLAPYETQLDTWVGRTGHVVVFSSMYFALLLKVEVSNESSTSQQVFELILVASHTFMVWAVVVEAVIVTFSLRSTTQQEPRRGSLVSCCNWKRVLFPFDRRVPPVDTFDLELTIRPSRSGRLY